MGSQSDWQTMKHAAETLDALGVDYDARIVSAHRTPERLYAFAKGAKAAGFKVIIAGAGGAAHLPGMTAAMTSLPVFGVPVESKALSGQDSLYSIVQMPAGVPVGTLAIGKAGAINAALLAAGVLALSDPASASAWRPGGKRQTGKPSPSAPEGLMRVTRRCACSARPAPRSAFWAAASSAACWRSPRPARLQVPHLFAPTRNSPPSTSCSE